MPGLRSDYTDAHAFFGTFSPVELAARLGTPLYVYNESILRQRCRELLALSSLPGFKVFYSAKANANPALLRIAREEGLMVDAMSPGELVMHEKAGFSREQILYVCNNVAADEMRLAHEKSFLLSVDSLSQLETFGRILPGKKIMVRVNPGVGAGHHKKVVTAGKDTKFGVNPEDFSEMRRIVSACNLELVGLNQHVGSLFMDPEAFFKSVEWLLETAKSFPGLQIIDFGGGFGIPYRKYENQPRLDLKSLGQGLHSRLSAWTQLHNYQGRFFLEPGRYVTAECGLLLGTVQAVKNNGPTRYAGTDLGFNVLARPMLYDAFHDVEVYGVDSRPRPAMEQTVVGNICESGDILAKDRMLPELRTGDILGILDAGAYGFAMSSTYNQRLRPAEVLITAQGEAKLIRRRETVDDLLKTLEFE